MLKQHQDTINSPLSWFSRLRESEQSFRRPVDSLGPIWVITILTQDFVILHIFDTQQIYRALK